MIVNARHTNARGDFCTQNCDGIDESRITNCLTAYDGHCHKKTCNGRIFHCLSINNVYTCELDKRSDRRFPWAYSYITEKTWGKQENCEGEDKTLITEHGSISILCVNCMCICAEEDDETKAIRTFSLIPQFANIKNNMVVTGVRFRESGKMFHVQIEESKLGALGEIVPGTSKWKKLNSFNYELKTGTFKMRERERLVSKQLHENFDYKIFKMDTRSVNFDLLRTPIGKSLLESL
ncbi:uncharacterized protein LOC141526646 [Cotesia typhae]|uniref:uncharacterized protein LOC141526646 n=1 Tax=Cotesia typhae TaxID=2053667 RepID=UPI003D686067